MQQILEKKKIEPVRYCLDLFARNIKNSMQHSAARSYFLRLWSALYLIIIFT